MKNLLLLAFLGFVLNATAQQHVKLVFDTPANCWTGCNAEAVDAQQCANGNTVAVGTFSSTVAACYIVLLDPAMNVIWQHYFYCQIATEIFEPWQVGINNKTGGFYVVCEEQYNTGPIYSYTWLIEFDTLGNLLWQHRYDPGSSQSAQPVYQLYNGNFAIPTNNQSASGVMFADSAGNFLQAVSYSSGRGEIVPDSTGMYIIGYSGNQMRILRTDMDGNYMWSRKYSHPNSTYTIEDACRSRDGGLLICGGMNNAIMRPFIMKFDSMGSILWRHVFIDSSTVNGMIFDEIAENDSGVITTVGHYYTSYFHEPSIVTRYDRGGTILGTWMFRDPGNPQKFYYAFELHPATGNRMLMMGNGPYDLPSTSQYSIAILLTDTAGNIGCPVSLYPLSEDSIPLDVNMTDTPPSVGTFTISDITGPFGVGQFPVVDVLTHCYGLYADIASVGEENAERNVTVFPVPFTEEVTVESASEIETARLIDVNGNILQEFAVGGTRAILDLSRYPTGIYFLEITSGNGITREKIVKY